MSRSLAKLPTFSLEIDDVLHELDTSKLGLSTSEAEKRLKHDGSNEIASERNTPALVIFLRQFKSPLVLVLIGASLISFALGERTETAILFFIVLAGGTLAFVQEYHSERALCQLRELLSRQAMVKRNGKSICIDARSLVMGDVVELDLGTVIPADLRLIQAENLEIDESVITGESIPVAKMTNPITSTNHLPQEQVNMAFMGTHVVQGTGLGVVVAVGTNTEMGSTAALLAARTEETDFQKGIRVLGSFLLKVTLGLAFVVASILGLIHGNWGESLLFSLALAVSISPELLPVIVTINLSRGALAMSKKHVLVKRLIAIEDLGNADVFCTDKTGTLTIGKLRARESIDPEGNPSSLPLAYAAHCLEMKASGQTSNPLDQAILEATHEGTTEPAIKNAVRYDIVSFDFTRRRMSCIVGKPKEDKRLMIVKGATAEVIAQCTSRIGTNAAESLPMTAGDRKRILACSDSYHDKGYRLLAVGRRPIATKKTYSPEDEKALQLIGFVLVSDAPKVTAKAALIALQKLNTNIKILTGDNERVTRHVAQQIGFNITGVLTGDDLDRFTGEELERRVENVNVFARITPAHKLRVIRALKANGHTVGFMGDGVNDAPALRAADVGISFDNAVEVAKEAASIILLQKKLSVLADGIREGRRTFINTRTYLRATISSNFGNMLSVAGSSLMLPFIPLLPAQILLLNLLGDMPMLGISADHVNENDLATPLKWDTHQISNFMYFFGSISSLVDYATFGLLLFVAHADVALFRSSWFIESILTQVIVISLLRTKKLTFSNPPGKVLIYSSLAALLIAFLLNMTSLGKTFEFVPLPTTIILSILLIVAGYAVFVELGKVVYARYFDTMPILPQEKVV